MIKIRYFVGFKCIGAILTTLINSGDTQDTIAHEILFSFYPQTIKARSPMAFGTVCVCVKYSVQIERRGTCIFKCTFI